MQMSFSQNCKNMPPTIPDSYGEFPSAPVGKGLGTHLLIDLFDAKGLGDVKLVERALNDTVVACGATLLHLHLHPFSSNHGISGVALLAESHISIHTWPEKRFAALDVFMCGDARPDAAIEVLRAAFNPGRIDVRAFSRGAVTCRPVSTREPGQS